MKFPPHPITPADAEDAAAGFYHDPDDTLPHLAWLVRWEGIGHRLVTYTVLGGVVFVVVGLATGWL
jgi:hypothetical protein